MVVITGCELFTGTCLMIIPALEGTITPLGMARTLAVVYRVAEEKPRYLHLFGKPLAASVLMGLCAHFSYRFLSGVLGNTLATLGAIGIAVVVYLVLVLALRVITREDLEMVPKGDKIARILHIR